MRVCRLATLWVEPASCGFGGGLHAGGPEILSHLSASVSTLGRSWNTSGRSRPSPPSHSEHLTPPCSPPSSSPHSAQPLWPPDWSPSLHLRWKHFPGSPQPRPSFQLGLYSKAPVNSLGLPWRITADRGSNGNLLSGSARHRRPQVGSLEASLLGM